MSAKPTKPPGVCTVVFLPSTRTRTLITRPTREDWLILKNWLIDGKRVSLRIESPPGEMELEPLWISLLPESLSVWRRALAVVGIRLKPKQRRELSTSSDT
jgi:hypothetical protein